MLKDSKKALMELDRNLAKEVIQRDTEVDRFYLLIVRQLKAALRNPELARDLGMSNTRECLGYRLVVKNIERIADHSEMIAEHSLKITRLIPEITEQISNICEKNEKIFDDIMKCLNFKDMKSVNTIIEESQWSIESIRNLDKIILDNPHLSDRIQFNSVSESLKRIAGHSADIAEVVLNMSILEPDIV
jgi:phosphate uptake regulator